MDKNHPIINLIKKYDNISLFFHEHPDFDALGSVFAFKEFIKVLYPKKTVCVIGINQINKQYYDKFLPFSKETNKDDNWVKTSLGIICDTANSSRVQTQKHLLCKETIRIDHHPEVEHFGNVTWVDSTMSSVCEMLAHLFINWDEKAINDKISSYLYIGILTDTNRFFYLNTSADTLRIVAKLYSKIKDRLSIHLLLNEKTLDRIKFENDVFKLIKFDNKNHIASLLIPNTLFSKYKTMPESLIYLMSNIKDINVWTSLYYDLETKKWKGSIRSKKIDISKVAIKFNGGGHKNASGFKLNSSNEFVKVINELKKLTE
ncbi:MAG: bifunctional oligoribonuclease/PAP phosphatase NrnA [Mycoplasmoidaceae bacterium]|nr:MAG: bifunctional oligoribonuclease/PAP phosphatase NrnA [Mycoplasmoidaceae bacterium]